VTTPKNNAVRIKVCTKVSLDTHVKLQAVCGSGRPYRSIEHFLQRAVEKALTEAGRGPAQAKPYDHEYAPKNDLEWRWVYGLTRYLRHGKTAYPALRQLLAELFKIHDR
jgi:hypothetical protein